jgi:hypothetical protein
MGPARPQAARERKMNKNKKQIVEQWFLFFAIGAVFVSLPPSHPPQPVLLGTLCPTYTTVCEYMYHNKI